MIREVEHLCCEERLSELGLYSLEKRRQQRDLTVAFQYTKGIYKKDGGRLFTRACSDRTRDSGFKLKVIGRKEEIFYDENGETLKQVSQRSCGSSVI